MLGGASAPADEKPEPDDGDDGDETGESPNEQEEDLLGVEIEITPAGKDMKRLSLLSGGEKSMTALAFLFAVFLARPCPFYILDEVEAALDDLNIDRFLELLRTYSGHAQFIVVTHQKRTMEAADSLYGVSMGADGISKVISRRLPPQEASERNLAAPWHETGEICSSSTARRVGAGCGESRGRARDPGAAAGHVPPAAREPPQDPPGAHAPRSRRRCSRISATRPGSGSRRR